MGSVGVSVKQAQGTLGGGAMDGMRTPRQGKQMQSLSGTLCPYRNYWWQHAQSRLKILRFSEEFRRGREALRGIRKHHEGVPTSNQFGMQNL
jgi:hypothetical protein